MFFVAGMELRSCERTPHRSQGPQNAYSLPGASFIPVVGRPWPIQLRSPRYLVSSLTSWCGVLYISVSISWTRSFFLLRTHFVRGIEFAIKVPASRKPLILLNVSASGHAHASHLFTMPSAWHRVRQNVRKIRSLAPGGPFSANFHK